MRTKLPFLIPEVVQSSGMDCGPACLKSLLEGHGISVSYGRLREACQTDVDGTSINTLESLAQSLGLNAEQVVVPAEHVFAKSARSLPAIVVAVLPNGFTHFVVVWRTLGAWVQVMDPAIGRRWMRKSTFLSELYAHRDEFPLDGFLEWAHSDDFLNPLRELLSPLRCGSVTEELIAAAKASGTWESIANLDAAARCLVAMHGARAIGAGSQAESFLRALVAAPTGIPDTFVRIESAPNDADGNACIRMRGAVLVRVRGKSERPAEDLPLSLTRALVEPPAKPLRAAFSLLPKRAFPYACVLAWFVVVASVATLMEVLLLRGWISVLRELRLPHERLVASGLLVGFFLSLLSLEVPLGLGVARLGRWLELGLRRVLFSKIPSQDDRYFKSRLLSDMASRAHLVHTLRSLPEVFYRIARAGCESLITLCGIYWIDRHAGPLPLALAAFSLAVPLITQRYLREFDLRMQTHQGAIGRFHLDALLGLAPIRAHGGEGPLRTEHEKLLVEWVRAARRFLSAKVGGDALQQVIGVATASMLVFGFVARTHDPAGLLLLVYWALQLPLLSYEMAEALFELPRRRNTALRLLEPLGQVAPPKRDAAQPVEPFREAVRIDFNSVEVRAGGHTVLHPFTLSIQQGEHVAIVGPSGAGKSTLLGLMLGWHRPSTGEIVVNGRVLDDPALDALRSSIAWIDPDVHLWNRSLLENLTYGQPRLDPDRLGKAIDSARLSKTLERLPDGLRSLLGESGGFVSGGEGQRVRVGRALTHPKPALALLDEPFRGLDVDARRALLATCREFAANVTMMFVTHDVRETTSFARVLVVENGTIVEDGAPSELLSRPDSRYRALFEADTDVHERLWRGAVWKSLRLDGGRVQSTRGES